MDAHIAHRRCHAALEPVVQAVVEAQSIIASVKMEAEASDNSTGFSEIDAVATQLGELKAAVRTAKAALDSVHGSRRHWPAVVGWALVLLALPILFILGVDLIGPTDPAAYALDCEAVSGLTCFVNVSILVWVSALVVRRKLLPVWWPRTHAAMTAAKRDKAVGYAIKTLFRLIVLVICIYLLQVHCIHTCTRAYMHTCMHTCMCMHTHACSQACMHTCILLVYLLQYWSFDGLRMGGGPIYGANVSTARMPHEYCSGAHGVARRLWHVSKARLHDRRLTSLLPTSYLLPPTSYLLPPPYFLPPTSYLLPPSPYLLPPTSYLLFPASYLLLSASYSMPPTSYLLPPAAYLLPPTPCLLLPTPYLLPPTPCILLPTPYLLPPN